MLYWRSRVIAGASARLSGRNGTGMVCARCGQMYAEVVPVYCVCGTPLNQGAGHWEATVALPNQSTSRPVARPSDDAMPTTFATAPGERSTMIWADRSEISAPPRPPSTPHSSPARSRTAMLIGIACILFAMAGVALFGAVALAQHPSNAAGASHNTLPSAATASPQHKITATPTVKPNPLALQNWQQNSTCVIRDNAIYVTGTGSHQSGYLCDAPVGVVSNATVTSQATFVHGGSSAAIGIAVRVNRNGKSVLSADEVYLNASGSLVVMQRLQGETHTLLAPQLVPGAATGIGATNTLTVTTQGDMIAIAVNGQPVTSVEDHDSPITGGVALAVWKYGQAGTFSNTTLTMNP